MRVLSQAELVERFEKLGYQKVAEGLPEGCVAYRGRALLDNGKEVNQAFVVDETALMAWSSPGVYLRIDGLQVALANLKLMREWSKQYPAARDFYRGKYQQRALTSLQRQPEQKEE